MILIQHAHVIDPASHLDAIKDILIEDGRIVKISDQILNASPQPVPNLTVIDATGLIAAPGLIDTHSHFRDPGFTAKEDIHTGSLAAAKGGYTSIVMMANTNPTIDCVEVLNGVLTRGKAEPVHIYSAANVTMGMKGNTRTDMASLAEAGAVVFTDDGVPVTDESLFINALKLARKLGKPVSLHEEDPAYVYSPGVNSADDPDRGPHDAASENSPATHQGVLGASREAEISMVRRDVSLAATIGTKLCIQHISAAESVALVREARKRSPLIHAEATPHHFSLTEEAVDRTGTLARVNPPVRLESDRKAIIEALIDGTIDIIATDHAPHTVEEKSRPFAKAPSGMIGLETALSLGIKHLVQPGHLTMEHMLACLTCNPADFYELSSTGDYQKDPAGRLREGGSADLVLFDPGETWTVTADGFASKASNSPFIGETLPGVVHYTITAGRIMYTNTDMRK